MVMSLSKLSKIIFPAIIVILGIAVLHFFNNDTQGGVFTVSNTGVRGASLFFDTLQHMGYPVSVSRSPLTVDTSTSHMYVIIQPAFPPCGYKIEEILDWVERGGKLIFLQNSDSFRNLLPSTGTPVGDIWIHELGQGIVITGTANEITNYNLMNTADIGIQLHAIITHLNTDRIIFAEYYHIAPVGDNLFSRLPLIVRLVFIQLGLTSLIAIWYLGKRFGNPVPYHNEIEREENEHVHAVTRLYLKIRRK